MGLSNESLSKIVATCIPWQRKRPLDMFRDGLLVACVGGEFWGITQVLFASKLLGRCENLGGSASGTPDPWAFAIENTGDWELGEMQPPQNSDKNSSMQIPGRFFDFEDWINFTVLFKLGPSSTKRCRHCQDVFQLGFKRVETSVRRSADSWIVNQQSQRFQRRYP